MIYLALFQFLSKSFPCLSWMGIWLPEDELKKCQNSNVRISDWYMQFRKLDWPKGVCWAVNLFLAIKKSLNNSRPLCSKAQIETRGDIKLSCNKMAIPPLTLLKITDFFFRTEITATDRLWQWSLYLKQQNRLFLHASQLKCMQCNLFITALIVSKFESIEKYLAYHFLCISTIQSVNLGNASEFFELTGSTWIFPPQYYYPYHEYNQYLSV